MAHEIDTSNNRSNIAYIGDTPWHGLGQRLTSGQPIEVWRKEAGLDFTVERAVAEYHNGGVLHKFPERHVLFRSDTGVPLSVVSDQYKIVQPGEVLEFFRSITATGGFELETAGSLAGGKKVWALARVNDGANIIGQDTVRPYLLFATSFDGGLSTTAKFTAIRVVCNNTLTMSAGNGDRFSSGQREADITDGAVVQCVRISHDKRYDADEVRAQLGIAITAWDQFLIQSRLLAEKELDPTLADEMTYDLIEPSVSTRPGMPAPDIRMSRGYQTIMKLYSGAAIGANLTEGPSAWAWLNSVTEYVDWHRGRTRDSGMNSAWFGEGAKIKDRALEMAIGA